MNEHLTKILNNKEELKLFRKKFNQVFRIFHLKFKKYISTIKIIEEIMEWGCYTTPTIIIKYDHLKDQFNWSKREEQV